jgi:hypothetical protein
MSVPHTPSIPSTASRRAFLGIAAGALILPFALTQGAVATPAHRARREKPAPSLEILTDILQQLPGSLAVDEDPPIAFTYADLAAQLDALDIAPSMAGQGAITTEIVNAIPPLPLGQIDAFLYSLDAEFTSAIGFDPMAVAQALQTGFGPTRTALFRGGFDPASIHRAWEASGYEATKTSTGQTAWSSGPNGEFSPTDPLQRRTVGSMNNALVLDDEWLVFTRTFDQLDAIATFAAATTEDSLFAVAGVRDAIAMLNEKTVSAVALHGSMLTPDLTFPLGSSLPEDLVAADEETGPLPAAALLMMAVTGGVRAYSQEEDASVLADVVVQARLAMDSPSDAEAAAEIVPSRWETLDSPVSKVPYTRMLEVAQTESIGTIAGIDFSITGPPPFWYRFIDQRDWLPFVTTGA